MFKKQKWEDQWAVYLVNKKDEEDKHLIFVFPLETTADNLVADCNRILEGKRIQ
jgi:hypothetical protein